MMISMIYVYIGICVGFCSQCVSVYIYAHIVSIRYTNIHIVLHFSMTHKFVYNGAQMEQRNEARLENKTYFSKLAAPIQRLIWGNKVKVRGLEVTTAHA